MKEIKLNTGHVCYVREKKGEIKDCLYTDVLQKAFNAYVNNLSEEFNQCLNDVKILTKQKTNH